MTVPFSLVVNEPGRGPCPITLAYSYLPRYLNDGDLITLLSFTLHSSTSIIRLISQELSPVRYQLLKGVVSDTNYMKKPNALELSRDESSLL